MTNLNNIVVFIKDDAMLEEARRILVENGENFKLLMQYEMASFNFLQYDYFDNFWFLSNKIKSDTEITLTELETRLKEK